jgi:DNA modification methylase
MQQQLIKISSLKNNTGQVDGLPKNPRLIKDHRYAKLKASLEADPEMMELREVIAYDNNGELVVICGNMRLRALKELGVKEVPVKVLPKETPPEKLRAYTIKDNVGFGEDDWDILANDWDALELEDFGVELPDLSTEEEAKAKEDNYEQPEVIKTDIVPGDLFEIGQHRLLCGDSADSDQVGKLMDGELADMCFTDPPYGVAYTGKTKDALTIESDDVSPEKLKEYVTAWFSAVDTVTRPGGYLLATVPAGPLHLIFAQDWLDRGWLRQIMVWNKSGMVLGHSEYHYKHEPILFGWKPGGERLKNSDRTKTTVWDFDKPSANREHPTMKPVEMWAYGIKNHTNSGDVLYEPFTGSGTTMVAAEQLGRKCYGMELDPKYCAVIIDRMQKAFPGIEIKRNGEPYLQEALS